MFDNLIIKDDDYISSYKLARMSDFVYSEVCTVNQFEQLDKSNLKIINQKDNKVFYISKELILGNNFTIFTNRYFLNSLFKELHRIKDNQELNIIVHQTDISFTEKEFKLKPKNVNKIYTINLDYDAENLIPLPLGLSNSYSDKNLLKEDFQKSEIINFEDKKDILYINFNQNTNHFIRDNLYDKFERFDWVEIDKPNLSKDIYFNKINMNKFILSPWGNGIDTHRIWESLYSKSIPVTKYHHTFSTSNNLPIIFVNEYSEISIEFLKNKENDMFQNKYKFDILKTNYWKKEIIKNTDSNNLKNYKSGVLNDLIQINNYKIKIKIQSYIKIINYYLKKIGNKLKNEN